jgi:CRISPR-associated protein Cmr6
MRNVLRNFCKIDAAGVPANVPDHLGLAYTTWAPVVSQGSDRSKHGKVPDAGRTTPNGSEINPRELWLDALTRGQISSDYKGAFGRWKSGFHASGHIIIELTLASRLLIGHGNPSATEVGLTVHHTWGVPIITGSALKGLCAHYTVSSFGPEDLKKAPWEQTDESQSARAAFQAVLWDGNKIKAGPGGDYRALFGAPDAQLDEAGRAAGWDTGAARGEVIFHDALYDPRCYTGPTPFKADILTVHQKEYYKTAGQANHWPNDYDSPNPVAFLTVKPKAKFLIALGGSEEETVLAAYILSEALSDWGVGGKTSLGYGRGKANVIKPWKETLP